MATGTIEAGGNVKFLLGSQTGLEKYFTGQSKAQNGAFYMTEDTHRLYIGTKTGSIVPVNEGVMTVETIGSLPKTDVHAGEFYYVKEGNILCVYSGSTAGWVQINTNTDTYYTDANTTISLAGKVATLTKTFTKNNNTEASDLTDSWSLEVADGINIEVNGDNVKLTGAKITGFNATATNNVATVTLSDSFNNTAKFNIKSKTSKYAPITVETEEDGKTKTVVIDVAKQTNTGVSVDNGRVVDGEASTEGFTVKVSDGDGTVEGGFNPLIRVGTEENTYETVAFNNGIANLPVYTKDEVDALKIKLNAMTYKGLVGKTASQGISSWSSVMSSNEISVGDTYLFNDDITFTDPSTNKSVTVTKGTLAIAGGTEGNNGYITGTIKWDYVESTKDTDTHFKLKGIDNGVQLVSHVGAAERENLQKIVFAAGTEINQNVTTTDGVTTVKFNHASHSFTPGTTTALSQGGAVYSKTTGKAEKTNEITVVDSMVVNAQGHVTGFSTRSVTLKDTNATLGSIGTKLDSVTTSSADGVTTSTAILTSHATLKDSSNTDMDTVSSNWNLVSKSLTFTKDDKNNLNVDLVWGTF